MGLRAGPYPPLDPSLRFRSNVRATEDPYTMLISALTDRPTRAEGALESDRTLADPGFFDGLILGSILLGGAFISVYVGFFLVPAFWIVLLCGWPLIIVTLVSFELWKRYSRSEVMRGKGLPFMTPRTTKSCPYCGTWTLPRRGFAWFAGRCSKAR